MANSVTIREAELDGLKMKSRPMSPLTTPKTSALKPPPRKEPKTADTPMITPMTPRTIASVEPRKVALSIGFARTTTPAVRPSRPRKTFQPQSSRSMNTEKSMKAP